MAVGSASDSTRAASTIIFLIISNIYYHFTPYQKCYQTAINVDHAAKQLIKLEKIYKAAASAMVPHFAKQNTRGNTRKINLLNSKVLNTLSEDQSLYQFPIKSKNLKSDDVRVIQRIE